MQTAKTREARRYTYKDCLRGTFEHPSNRLESIVFDALFAFAMATAMVLTVNLEIRPILFEAAASMEDGLSSLKMLPLLWLIAFAIRLLYADRLSMWAFRRFVAPRATGIASSVMLVLINVAIMAPVMCACAVVISGAPVSAVPEAFRTVLPFAAAAGFALCMVAIRPLVMLAFSNVYVPMRRKGALAGSPDGQSE